jgi:hypothetical protein
MVLVFKQEPRHDQPTHAVAQNETRRVRLHAQEMLSALAHTGQKFIEMADKNTVAGRLSMAGMIERHNHQAACRKHLRQCLIATAVLAQAVNNDHRAPHLVLGTPIATKKS